VVRLGDKIARKSADPCTVSCRIFGAVSRAERGVIRPSLRELKPISVSAHRVPYRPITRCLSYTASVLCYCVKPDGAPSDGDADGKLRPAASRQICGAVSTAEPVLPIV
jgi:hypothetical protein